MISYEARNVTTGKDEFSFKCLSSDTKPVGAHGGRIIANGSSLVEMDTGKVYLYDEDGAQWREF